MGEPNDFVKLAPVEKVRGLYFDGERALLQYESGGKTYEVAFPLTEILKSEEWFIKLRRRIGAQVNLRWDSSSQ